MRIVIQRVSSAAVEIDLKQVGAIEKGLLLLVGIVDHDTHEDIEYCVRKVGQMRIFNDANDTMNLSLIDIAGEALIISQFTLFANTKKGNRPSYIHAAKPDFAIPIYEQFITRFESFLGRKCPTGIFGADMKISLINDGPVTIIVDSKNK